MSIKRLSHLAPSGEARMVDVSAKKTTLRTAVASCEVRMAAETLRLLRSGSLKKGDAFTVAKVAGMLAAKRTPEFIPLCHPLPLEHIDIRFLDLVSGTGVLVEAEVRTTSKTGVEIEALHAVLIAGLTIYDMAKSCDPAMEITQARLLTKKGGKSDYAFEGRGFNGQ